MSIEKVTITKFSATDKKKDGTDCVTKHGKKFWKAGIQTKEYGEEWLNGLIFKEVNWVEGDVVDIEVKKEEYNGKESLKFRVPKSEEVDQAEKDAKIAELEAKLAKAEGKDESTEESTEEEKSDDDINPDDIPL